MVASTMKLHALFISLTIVTAFTSPKPPFASGVSSRLHMFSADDESNKSAEPNPLEEVTKGEDDSAKPMESTTLDDMSIARNFGRAGEVKEVQWVDPAMRANTNPLEMSPWAYALFGFPFVLLADDIFHFIPDFVKEGPVGFIF